MTYSVYDFKNRGERLYAASPSQVPVLFDLHQRLTIDPGGAVGLPIATLVLPGDFGWERWYLMLNPKVDRRETARFGQFPKGNHPWLLCRQNDLLRYNNSKHTFWAPFSGAHRGGKKRRGAK